ncbi:MAG: PIG-L family deacetylase [Chloroflexia bacterium]|nr:PIG-L family deacetylase [Chloroflexia bacterium]
MSSISALPDALAGTTRHLFLSPHYDDIALSVGATVRLLADQGLAPETWVVFGSEPYTTEPLSAFARTLHDAWGLNAEEVIASRQAEEQQAASVMGAQTGVLPFRDAIYRGNRYRSNDDLFGPPAAAESSLPEEIIGSLVLGATPTTSTRIYAPLGVGRHVDHQIVFLAGMELATRGWEVWFYEDIPYALKPNALENRLAEISESFPLQQVAWVPVQSVWETKLDAILSYPTQLEMVFRNYVGVGTSRDEISAALGTYAAEGSGGILTERFWQVAQALSDEGS